MSRTSAISKGAKFRLALRKLDFISPVDDPAQETAKVKLLKREMGARARVVKLSSDELGLVFCWAFTSDVDGEPYFDLQGDQVVSDDSMIKAAADFMADGGVTDEMHDGEPDGRVVFCMPMTADVAKAFGIETDTHGLMVALKPSPEVFEKFKTGEYTGVSIAGAGEREKVTKLKCEKCSSYMAKDASACPQCNAPVAEKRVVDKSTWSTATIDDLPDSSFLYIEQGGKKDDDGKTTPRSLRHFPYKDENGEIDLAHLRDAISRIPQSSLPATLRNKLQQKAEKLLGAQHTDKRASAPIVKHAYLTTAVAGHTHILDHDNGQAAGYTDYAAMSDGSDFHQHPWVRDTNGTTFVIGEAAGHTHEVVSQDSIDQAVADGDPDVDEDLQQKRKGNAMPIDPKLEKIAKDPAKFAKKLEEAEAEIERWKAKYTMTDAQRAFYKSLERDEDKTAFLAKSHAERDVDVKKAADVDAVVYTARDGRVFRKSANQDVVAAVKQADEAMALVAKRDGELELERLTKRANTEIGHLPGEVKGKIALLKAIDGIADEGERAIAKAAVAAGHNALAPMFKGIGHGANPSNDGAGASLQEQLDALTKQHAEKNNVSTEAAMAAVLKTAQGKQLYAQIEAAKRN